MTISYQDSFLRVLLRWKGSVWKAVWRELLLWSVTYATLRLVLQYGLPDELNADVARLIRAFRAFTEKVPLEFLLGFYVVQVVNRWWEQVKSVPWPDEAVAWTNAVFAADDEQTRLRRHTVARYLILSEVMALRNLSTRVRQSYPTVEHVADSGLMTQEELLVCRQCPCESLCWQLPLDWAINNIIIPATSNRPGELPVVAVSNLINLINAFRKDLRLLFIYDWICIPLVYTQTVSVVVYGYFILCLVGHQQYLQEPDIFLPVLTVFQFLFYVGWLKVAQDLMRPLGLDDDDVELNYILDRHFRVALSMVHYGKTSCPSLQRDIFFDSFCHPQKTDETLKLPKSKSVTIDRKNDHPPKLHAKIDSTDSDMTELSVKSAPSTQASSVVIETSNAQNHSGRRHPSTFNSITVRLKNVFKRAKTPTERLHF